MRKTIIVTGANSGIGFAAAHAFAQQGAHVVLACRNPRKADEAAARITAEVPGTSVEGMELDLASLASTRSFAAKVIDRSDRIDVLVNNAGVMSPPQRLTSEDGFELQFGVNHLGHFALTGLLFDSIALSAPSRVVTVSSGAHHMGSMDFADLQWSRRYRKRAAYGRSKLANLLFAYELDRRIRARGLDVRSVACHPGLAKSNLINAGPQLAGNHTEWWMRLAYAGAQSTEQGAAPTLMAALDETVHGGQFIGPSGFLQSRGAPRVVPSSTLSHDVEVAQRLWSVSEELTGMHYLD